MPTNLNPSLPSLISTKLLMGLDIYSEELSWILAYGTIFMKTEKVFQRTLTLKQLTNY